MKNQKLSLSIHEISTLFKDHNIVPSLHRISIYQYLLENNIHPTAEQIYKELINHIPSLSKTTVYNSVKILAEKGLIIELPIENNELRYDAQTYTHAHFKCIVCGRVYDIPLEEPNFKEIDKKIEAAGHKTLSRNFLFKGICNRCLSKKDSTNN